MPCDTNAKKPESYYVFLVDTYSTEHTAIYILNEMSQIHAQPS